MPMRSQEAGPQRPVDGPAVVGVDEAQVPELASLVDVGHAGNGEAQQRLREPIQRPVPLDRVAQVAQVG